MFRVALTLLLGIAIGIALCFFWQDITFWATGHICP